MLPIDRIDILAEAGESRSPRAKVSVKEEVSSLALEFDYTDGHLDQRRLLPLPPPRGKQRKGEIYVLVGTEGPSGDRFGERLRKQLADAFYKDPSGSLTSSLVRAIRRVNDELFAENDRTIRTDRRYATVVCAVRRGDDVYFALVGRALAFLVRPEGCERFGRGDPRPGERPVDLLGQFEDVEVELHHRPIEGPSSLILASSGLADFLGANTNAVLRGDPERLVMTLRRLGEEGRGRRSFRAIVVVPEGSWLDEDVDDEPPLMDRRAISETREPKASERRRSPFLLTDDRPVRRRSEWIEEVSTSRESIDPPRVATPRRPKVSTLPAEPKREESLPVSRRRPRRSSPRLDVVALALRLVRKPTISLRAILIAMLVICLFFLGYVVFLIPARILRGGAPYTSAISDLSQAQQLEQQALGQNDALVRRHLLQEAEQLSQSALIAQPDDSVVAAVAGRIENEYRAASRITDLPSPMRLAVLPTTGDEMLLNGLELYVLDRTNSLIYKYLLNADGTQILPSQNPVLVRKGDHIGTLTVGQLNHIAWMPAGNGRVVPALLALDAAGFLVEYNPTHGLTTEHLRASDSWSDVTSIGGYAGNLYVLNATHQTLAWYPPQNGGYDGPVYNYFAPGVSVNLADAVDLAVGDNVYVLHASGTVQKFAGGKQVDFVGPPSDLLPSHPAGVALGENSIFIGDPERADVIQLLNTGEYQRELSVSGNQQILKDMRDLIVSSDGKSLYVLSGQAIYRFSLEGISQ